MGLDRFVDKLLTEKVRSRGYDVAALEESFPTTRNDLIPISDVPNSETREMLYDVNDELEGVLYVREATHVKTVGREKREVGPWVWTKEFTEPVSFHYWLEYKPPESSDPDGMNYPRSEPARIGYVIKNGTTGMGGGHQVPDTDQEVLRDAVENGLETGWKQEP